MTYSLTQEMCSWGGVASRSRDENILAVEKFRAHHGVLVRFQQVQRKIVAEPSKIQIHREATVVERVNAHIKTALTITAMRKIKRHLGRVRRVWSIEEVRDAWGYNAEGGWQQRQ
jgi:hypothetical protein